VEELLTFGTFLDESVESTYRLCSFCELF